MAHKLFISLPASATDENLPYVGIYQINVNDDPRDPANWHKSLRPVFTTSYEKSPVWAGTQQLLRKRRKVKYTVYHARNYTEAEGDPLRDPNRHTRLVRCAGDEKRMPRLPGKAASRYDSVVPDSLFGGRWRYRAYRFSIVGRISVSAIGNNITLMRPINGEQRNNHHHHKRPSSPSHTAAAGLLYFVSMRFARQ